MAIADDAPTNHPPGSGPGPRALAAALLNASGTGAGFLYVGARVLAAAALLGTALLILIANATDAADSPGLWITVYALWLAALAGGGWWRALPRRPRAQEPPPDPFAPPPAPYAPTAPLSPYNLPPRQTPGLDSPTVTLATPGPGVPPKPASPPAPDRPTMAFGSPALPPASPPPLPPAAPPPASPPPPATPAPRPGWRPFAVAGLLIAVVASGVVVTRGVPQSEFDEGQDAHAAGDCAEAIEHYDQVDAGWTQFTLPTAISDARRESESCEVLRDAAAREESEEYAEAIDGYQAYLDRYRSGGPVWGGAEAHLAGLRLDYADSLAEAALADTDNTLDSRYQETVNAYAAVREHHPDSPEAESVPERIDALYTSGTTAFAEENYCDAVGELQPFAELDSASDAEEAADLASRADEAMPRAHFGCGQSTYDSGLPCEAVEPFEAALNLQHAGASQALNQSRFDCGTARSGRGHHCEAIEPLEAVDGGGLVRRAANELRGEIYDCGVNRFRDGDHEAAREMFRRVRDEYDGSSEADRAMDMLIAVTVNEVSGGDPGALLPGGGLAESGGGGSVTMEIYNASDESMEVLYAGADYGIITIPAGPGGGESACDRSGLPTRTISLPTGDYQVAVRSAESSDSSVEPYADTWDADPGYIYEYCTYIEDYGLGYPDLLEPELPDDIFEDTTTALTTTGSGTRSGRQIPRTSLAVVK